MDPPITVQRKMSRIVDNASRIDIKENQKKETPENSDIMLAPTLPISS